MPPTENGWHIETHADHESSRDFGILEGLASVSLALAPGPHESGKRTPHRSDTSASPGSRDGNLDYLNTRVGCVRRTLVATPEEEGWHPLTRPTVHAVYRHRNPPTAGQGSDARPAPGIRGFCVARTEYGDRGR